jgi:hypothetical protein
MWSAEEPSLLTAICRNTMLMRGDLSIIMPGANV